MRKYNSTLSHLLFVALVATGCGLTDGGRDPADDDDVPGDSGGPPGNKAGTFESDLPTASGGRGGQAFDAGTAAPSAGDTSDDDSAEGGKNSNGGSEAERAIAEADIVQTAGDRLYALSRVAGLTVIDVTDPARLAILGRYRELNGTPFEMYLRDGVILAMYSSWGQYVKSGDSYSWVQTSKIVAIDVQNPAAMSVVGTFDLAGEVSDSRIVGDVMYVVGYQNGYCWGCETNKPKTTVLSLNVKNPRGVAKVDELAFADANNSWGWNKRSITVTNKRMYVAGPEYGQNKPTGSTIQVVDISDPAGDMRMGASIEAAGQISSRWQMDEYQGVLRVISQFPAWWGESQNKPLMQTFTVASSDDVKPLASVPITIPVNDRLDTVRFDGPRGYAVTSERKDPLFALDFSDPAHPRQGGEVKIPGWLYFLAPRGNRLIGLGYDQGNAQGAITVSLFDVTDLDNPQILKRVNFGGDWAYLPEDQDRIHKAFRILDDKNLILVPFSGWSSSSNRQYCWGAYRSGVQLLDLNGDQLALRGAAPSRGEARRAIVHKDKLLAVSDEAVDTYDLSNRDQPAQLGRLTIARNVAHALPLANQTVARINQDWYNQQNSTIDLVGMADLDRPDVSLGEVSLSALLGGDDSCAGYTYIDKAFARGNQVIVSYQRWSYGDLGGGKYDSSQTQGIVVVDATDPTKPAIAGRLESTMLGYDRTGWYPYSNYYSYGYSPAQQNTVVTENAIATLEQRYVSSGPTTNNFEMRLRVIDLRDPKALKQSTLALPAASGYSGLVLDGPNLMLSHYEELSAKGSEGRARFYVDRVDLTDPAAPKLAGKVNVPGSLMHYDRAQQRLLTNELVRGVVKGLTSEQCFNRFAFASFDYGANSTYQPDSTGTCTGYRSKLHLVRFVSDGAALEETYELAENERLSSSSMGDGRVAAVLSRGYGYYGGRGVIDDCFGPCGGYYGSGSSPVEILTIGGFATGDLTVSRLKVENLSEPWWGFWGSPPVYAFGTRALVQSQSDALVIDMTDVTAPTVVRKVPLYASPYSINASGSTVLLALGMNGVQRIDL